MLDGKTIWFLFTLEDMSIALHSAAALHEPSFCERARMNDNSNRQHFLAMGSRVGDGATSHRSRDTTALCRTEHSTCHALARHVGTCEADVLSLLL